jgi:nucleoside phosphorylase
MKILLLAAMANELLPLCKTLNLSLSSADAPYQYAGQYRQLHILGGITTMGMGAAEDYVKKIVATEAIAHVVFVGIAGAYSRDLKIGDLVQTRSVIDHRDMSQYILENLNAPITPGYLLSSDNISYDENFKVFLERNHIVAIDMEAGAIAAVCKQHNIPLTVCKAISDYVEIDKPNYDAFGLANPDGSPNLPAVFKYLLTKPWRITYLIKLGIGSNKAISASSRQAKKIIDQLDAY